MQAAFEAQEEATSEERLLRDYLPHVKRIVQRVKAHVPPHVDPEDLLNAGIVGLLSALRSYDPGRGTPLLAYALFRIKGAVLSELRDMDFLSRGMRRRRREMESALLRFEARSGREATDEEAAEEMGVSLDEFNRIRRESGLCLLSLDEVVSRQGEELGEGLDVEDQGADTLAALSLKELQEDLGGAIDELPEKERLVVSLYYWDELTMKEVAAVLGITESRVSQIHSRAVARLRASLAQKGHLEEP